MAIAIQPADSTQTLPGPKPVNGMLNMLRFAFRFSHDTLGVTREWSTQYGDMAQLEIGGVTQYNLVNPAYFHEVLVTQATKFKKDAGYTDPKRGLARFLGNGLITSNGDFWKRQRRLAAPALHTKRIASYAGTMVHFTQNLIDTWRDGQMIDVVSDMKKTTMEIVAKTLFDAEVSAEAERVHHALEAVQDASSGFRLLPTWIPTPVEIRARRANRELNAIIYKLIRERRATGEDKGDLLSMLLLARDDDGGMMSEEQARDEAMSMFLAGHETTATLMSWTFYLLSQYPAVEVKLHAELDRVLGGRAPTLDDLKALPYTEMVIKEALRFYPSAWIISREATEDVTIGGHDFKKGSVFSIMIYFMQHDARWYPNPETFDPERFSPENIDKIPKYAYIPFGDGPRICIGTTFAQMEAQLILASIAGRYRLTLKPGHKVEAAPRLTLNVKGALPMQVQKRAVQKFD